MNITVVGCGRWGSFIAWYLNSIGHHVTVYGRNGSKTFEELAQKRTNGLVTFEESIQLTTDPSAVLEKNEVLVISIGAQGLRDFLAGFPRGFLAGKTVVLCMKGIEAETGMRLSEIVASFEPHARCAVWVGPGHVQEFLAGLPNCMVIDSADSDLTEVLVKAFSSKLIRFYYGTDLIGSEVGAASKNVIGIAAGALDGLHRTSLKGALMSRGTREIARLIHAMGGNEMSAYGLCHLGDYEATVFSKYSHNRQYGESLVTGQPYSSLAEGVYTVKGLMVLSERYQVELPICKAVYQTIYEGASIPFTISQLFMRRQREEFYL